MTDHRYYSVGSLKRLPLTEAFLARRPAVILDRDGVLNKKAPKAQYVRSWHEFEWLAGAKEALRLFKEAGYRVIVVSNQAGVGRGAMTETQLVEIHERMPVHGCDRSDLLLSSRLGRRLRMPETQTWHAVPGSTRAPLGSEPDHVHR